MHMYNHVSKKLIFQACVYMYLSYYSLISVKQNYAVSKGLKLKPSPSGKENPKTKEMKKEKVILSLPEPLFWDILLQQVY